MAGNEFYDRMANAAARQVSEKGRWLILRRQEHSFNPATGLATMDYRDEMVIGLAGLFTEEQIDGTQVRRGDQRLLLAAQDLARAPTTADAILDGLETWQVVNVETVRPGGVALIHRLQVRR